MSFAVQVTWWGHSTTLIEQAGVRLLTDPVFSDRIAHLRRRRGPSPVHVDLEHPDVVLISHLHADHLHVPSLRRLGQRTTVVVPAGATDFLRQALGERFVRRCVELPTGQHADFGPVRVAAVPAAHDGRRHPLSRYRAQAVGYVVTGPGASTWFAGDTGLCPAMDTLGPVDLALVPVGGWGPTLPDGHLDPAGAADAVRRTGARWAVPVHYGTFWPLGFGRVRPHMFHGPGEEFERRATRACPTTAVQVLAPGEALAVPARAGPFVADGSGPAA